MTVGLAQVEEIEPAPYDSFQRNFVHKLIVLFFVMVMSIVSALSCRRLLPMLTFIVTAIEMMFFGIVDSSCGKDKLLTKFASVVKPTRKRFERSTS